jgi:hypothetical protein
MTVTIDANLVTGMVIGFIVGVALMGAFMAWSFFTEGT